VRRALPGIATLVLLAACGGQPGVAGAPVPDPGPVELFIPQRVASFRFDGRKDDPNPALGTQVRFAAADSQYADVFIYPGPDLGAECDRACATRLLAQETDGFVSGFGAMKAQGYVADIRVRESRPLTPGAGATWQMGRHFILDLVREGRAQRSDYWLVYLPGTRLKVRATYADTPPNVAKLTAFLDTVVSAFLTRPVPRVERPLPAAGVEATWSLLEGTWDWQFSENECKSGAHRLVATAARDSLILTYPDERDSTGVVRTVRYKVLGAGPAFHRWAPHTIRLEMEGEDRRNDAGALVLWDLVFMSRDRYHWHRTDWADDGMTKAVIRCDAPGRP
jgi:hypothetical protein